MTRHWRSYFALSVAFLALSRTQNGLWGDFSIVWCGFWFVVAAVDFIIEIREEHKTRSSSVQESKAFAEYMSANYGKPRK